MDNDELLGWLLAGDIAIQHQVHRDLLGRADTRLRQRITEEGWGQDFLARRSDSGHWGRGFYQPKWISSHYTLLDLRNLCAPPHPKIRETIDRILADEKATDGGIDPSRTIGKSDVCVTGMFLNYASYFGAEEEELKSVVDYLLDQRMEDGGFNCRLSHSGAVHSSLHSTLSVAEGIHEYARNGYQYGLDDLLQAEGSSREFILQHRLYRSDKTGHIIDKRMLMLSWPGRWRYDILRALDYFRSCGVARDERMSDAIDVLMKKRRKDGRWPLQAKHPGQMHFEMEKVGAPSRWNTLRALRVLQHFK